MIKEIQTYNLQTPPKCLLIGNGINRNFHDQSWEDMIKEELAISRQNCSYQEIKDLPATMQIVIATGDQVDKRMKSLSDRMMNLNMTSERILFLRELVSLPVDDILTTNYSFELEAACGMPLKKTAYSASLKNSFELENASKRFRLFQYFETSEQKRIWHIHGDVAKPDTMLMGHYYYAKQVKAVQECVAKTVRRYHYCLKENKPFTPYSWIDQFLTGDVFILGLGMYLCESDLWYLLCCKKRNFPERKVIFYDLSVSDIGIRKMLEAYCVEIVNGKELNVSNYPDFYSAAFQDIRARMKGEIDT